MDAHYVGKEDENKERNIASMLQEVSASFNKRKGSYPQFIQVTWEVPLYRLHYTLNKDEGYSYAWKCNERHSFMGDSEMYRMFIYEVNLLPSSPEQP